MKLKILAATVLSVLSFGMSQARAFSDPPYANDISFGPQLVKIIINFQSPTGPESSVCSGLLVNPSAVITAGHCLYQKNLIGIDVVDESFYSMGKANIQTVKIGTGYRGFEGEFNVGTHLTQLNIPNTDYAIFELTEAFPISWPAHAIRMAKSSAESKALFTSGNCYSAGFGPATLNGSAFSSNVVRLHPGNANFTSRGVLVSSHLGINVPSQLTPGDSGGPVMCYTEAGEAVLVGVNSGHASIGFGSVENRVTYDFFTLVDQDSEFEN